MACLSTLIAHHPALNHDASASIDAVQLEDILGDVDAERVDPRRGIRGRLCLSSYGGHFLCQLKKTEVLKGSAQKDVQRFGISPRKLGPLWSERQIIDDIKQWNLS